jgi:hypothetical protein
MNEVGVFFICACSVGVAFVNEFRDISPVPGSLVFFCRVLSRSCRLTRN